MSRTARRALLIGLMALVVYPLSLAPLDRAVYGTVGPLPLLQELFDSGDVPLVPPLRNFREWRAFAYRPVFLLVDSAWASGPLLLWGDLWRVGESQRYDSETRSTNRFFRAVEAGEIPRPANPLAPFGVVEPLSATQDEDLKEQEPAPSRTADARLEAPGPPL